MAPPETAALRVEMGEAERLAISHAPRGWRARYAAIFALDGVLGRIALSGREPLPSQLRLAWWRDALTRLPQGREHPVIVALADAQFAADSRLAALVDGWEAVLVDEGDAIGRAQSLGDARGAALSLGVARPAGDAAAATAARCWTLVGLSVSIHDEDERLAMLAAARAEPVTPLPRDLRPLALLAGLARRAARRGGGPLLGDRLSPLAAIRLGIFGR